MTQTANIQKSILIVCGGFAGINCAKGLSNGPAFRYHDKGTVATNGRNLLAPGINSRQK